MRTENAAKNVVLQYLTNSAQTGTMNAGYSSEEYFHHFDYICTQCITYIGGGGGWGGGGGDIMGDCPTSIFTPDLTVY